MTRKEKYLLSVAYNIMNTNTLNGVNIALTGSLMLLVMGIDKQREANDIDFVIKNGNVGEVAMPLGFSLQKGNGYINSIGLKVDFFVSDEPFEIVNNFQCTTIDYYKKAKLSLGALDEKHLTDLKMMTDGE
jgi:hypothetical protein